MAVINDYPYGITLGDIAKRLGVARVVLARTARKILEEGKVIKEGNLYFRLDHK